MPNMSISLYRMNRTRLWGRDAFAGQLMADVDAGCTIIGLEGVTGAGKTEFSLQFAQTCQEIRGPIPLVIDGGLASTEVLLIGKICARLREVPRAEYQAFEEKAQGFLGRLLPGMRKIGGAMVQDLANMAGIDKAEKTIEALANLLAGVDGELDPYAMLAEEDQSNRRTLIIEYLQFVTDLGNPLCIFIDNYELLESSAREFLKVLLRRKPGSCLLLIAVNTEIDSSSDWRSIMAPTILAQAGQVYLIPDLSKDEIAAWYKADIGLDANGQTVQGLIHGSHGGRPALLATILSAMQTGKGAPPIPNFDELQAARRRSLSANARGLGDLISLLPGDVVIPRDLLDAAAKAAGIDGRSAYDELYSASLVRRVGERVQFVHSSYAISWVSDITDQRRDELKELWYSAWEQAGYAKGINVTGGLLSLVAPRIVERQSSDEITKLATSLEQHGAQDDSLLLLTTSWQTPPDAGTVRDGVIEHALQTARLQMDLGRYAAAQEPLRAVELKEPDGTPLRNAADLLRMKLALRLNHYPLVWSLSNKLAKKASEDPAIQLERELIFNTALRDLMDEAGILASIERLQGVADDVGDADRAAINRSLARSYAKIGETEKALRLAKDALELADAEGDVRAIGNAHLALGEALRHAGRELDALNHYRDAIDYGSASGNRDSELWSRMGEASTHLQIGDLDPARASLAAAAALANDPGFEHPLETAHVALIGALTEILAGNAIDQGPVLALYRRLRISWPEAYIQETESRGALPRAIPL
jgi:tetratricopeptide (TPR) repeat protein